MLISIYYAFCTVQPVGIPLVPVGHVIELFLTNVPLAETFSNQLDVQLLADMSVARHFT